MTQWSAEAVALSLEHHSKSGAGWSACCPAHEDHNPSLSVSDGDDGKILLHCFAGCSYEAVATALKARGVELNGQANDQSQPPPAHATLGRYDRYWDYRNAAGLHVLRICRWDRPDGKKEIRPLSLTDEGWRWRHIEGQPRPLYRLPALLGSPPGRPVLVVEGEKTAEAAKALLNDFEVTTWAGGVNAIRFTDWSAIGARPCLLVPDADSPGRKCMESLAVILRKGGGTVLVQEPDFPVSEGWDIADATSDEDQQAVKEWISGIRWPTAIAGARLLNWKSLAGRDPPPRSWVIQDWLSQGTTLLSGPGGAGKTLIAQTLATCLAIQRPFLGPSAAQLRPLVWACEDEHDELWRRQADICRWLEVGIGDLPADLMIESRQGQDNALTFKLYGALQWTPLFERLKEQINDLHINVFFLDNIGQTFAGDENDRHHVTAFVNGLLGLCANPIAIVMLGHPAKQAGSEYSGSTAWQNSVRMRWYLGDKLPDQPQEDEEKADPSVRFLAKRKTNYSSHDWRKLEWASGLYVPVAMAATTAPIVGFTAQAAETCVVDALKIFGERGMRCTPSRASSDYLPKLILQANKSRDLSRVELDRALVRLRAAGKIIEIPSGQFYANRMPKLTLALAGQEKVL